MMLGRLYGRMLFDAGRVIISAQSLAAWYRTRSRPTVVHHEVAYDGRPILLLALYQKGAVRPDVRRLLETARAAGLYILAVNTLKVRAPDALRDLIDCYVERPNFGRDFGSYKTGFLHLYDRGWDRTCPRLLMINDSVFFTRDRLPRFLSDLIATPVEVLGATENYEIEYHLGSFCIAMDGDVVRSATLRDYWNDYRLSDVRPRVIREGEMRLSRTLKRISTSPREFAALYSANRFAAQIEQDDRLLNFAMRYGRTSNLTGWKRITPAAAVDYFASRFLIDPLSGEDAHDTGLPRRGALNDEQSSERIIERQSKKKVFVADYDDYARYMKNSVQAGAVDEAALRAMTAAYAAEVFMEGSQIHQNAAVLLAMGLPIVKLDGLYRGMFNMADLRALTDQLPDDEAADLRTLLMERPFGGQTLAGWKRQAFLRGYI